MDRYLSNSLPSSWITEKNISNWLEYLQNNNTLKIKQNNWKDSYFIVNESGQNMPGICHEKIPCPANFEIPFAKEKTALEIYS